MYDVLMGGFFFDFSPLCVYFLFLSFFCFLSLIKVKVNLDQIEM